LSPPSSSRSTPSRCSVLVRWFGRPWRRDTTTFPPFKGGSSSRRRCELLWTICHRDTAGSSITGGWKIRRNRMG
ncbi:hypothetical protein A2U01_0069998, partial [Trifolium medium]|nr:hypothetical protein [Trifolium medium]